jgi:hypothetical protein
MAIPKFPSKFLKLGSNVENGDVIRFLDAPIMDLEDKLYCNVGIIPKGFKEMTQKKKFQINKTNYKTIALLYGADCAEWVGKEVQIYEGTANNPSTGEPVPSIKLKAVGGADPEDVNNFINK